MTVPLLLLLFYLLFNMVLHINDEFRKLPAFRLMFYIGILDCIQLICHIFSGIVTVWPSINAGHPHLNRIMGATANSAWVCLFPLSFIISLYRLLIVRKLANPNSAFPLMVKVGIAVSFTYCFAFWICLLTFGEILYNPMRWSWSYTDEEGSVILSHIEVITCVPLITFTFIIYIAIAVSVNKRAHGVMTIRKTELQLIIHAGISFLVLTTLITFWHYYEFLFPDSMWTVFAINLYWMIYCGLDPLLYLVCSRNIRHSFLQFIGVAPPNRNVTFVSVAVKKTTQGGS